MNAFPWALALHLVSVVSLFAGLLYVVRLFIYHVEALEKPEPERSVLVPQYILMEKRLWYAIVNPALVGTTVFGLWLMWMIHAWTFPWFRVKLALVLLLFGYQGICGRIRRELAAGRYKGSARTLRLWNEAATVLLFTIVFTVVFRRPMGAVYGLIAVVVLGLVGGSVFFLKRRAKRNTLNEFNQSS